MPAPQHLADDSAPSDETALIARVQRGDREAFGALSRRYAQRALGMATRVMHHREDAEEVVQDAFIAALDHIATFELGRPFGPWFFRIVMTRALNACRARNARTRYTDVFGDMESERYVEPVDADLDRAEIRERLNAAIDELPERRRDIVRLVLADYSAAEISTMLDLPRGTIRWHMHEARAALRDALAVLRRLVA